MTRISMGAAKLRLNDDARPLPAINPADAKSPLRWLGNKDPDWKRISSYIQLAKGGSFFEPFGGSAATTFRVLAGEGRPITVHIAERVPELRAVIEAIRDNPRGFLKHLPRERCPERYKTWRAILKGGDWKGIDPLIRTVMWRAANTRRALSLQLVEPPYSDGGSCWHLYVSRKYDAPAGSSYTLADYDASKRALWRQEFLVGVASAMILIGSALVYFLGFLVAWIRRGFVT